MSTNEKIKLGQLITEEGVLRDAVHIAVAPVTAGAQLIPGDHIGFLEEGVNDKVGETAKLIGVVDPYLTKTVMPGDRFLMLLYPGTITSLRHDWEHPNFKALVPVPDTSASKTWITALAEKINQTYDELMDAGHLYASTADYTNVGDNQAYYHASSEDWIEFWKHFEIVTGIKPKHTTEYHFFSCSC